MLTARLPASTLASVAHEVNFDGLIGPTHNYSGLSFGNVASLKNANAVANPRQAARQGLEKMWMLRGLGLHQGVIAPQERPDLDTLRQLGFCGRDHEVIEQAARIAPGLLASCSSASSMWVANAATVSPSADTRDQRVHITPANLVNKFHRAIEPQLTGRILRAMFPDEAHFAHHRPLPPHDSFGDEGAANHTRLCGKYGSRGVEVFVYGKSVADPERGPKQFPARQTLEASRAIARLHGLEEGQTVYIQQNPKVIDSGVFHNDVIAVGNLDVLLYHQQAFQNTAQALAEINAKYQAVAGRPLRAIEVPTEAVSVSDAVTSYLFNTQLIAPTAETMVLVAPEECRETPSVHAYLETLVAGENPITAIHYIDVRESMKNGGGPACLRLRVVLTQAERAASNPRCLLTAQRYTELGAWIDRHYRDRLAFDDLCDPQLIHESRTALDELTQILGLGSVYRFQRAG